MYTKKFENNNIKNYIFIIKYMISIEKIGDMGRLQAIEKYNIFLKFINKILVNLNEDPIQDATKFKNIKKEDIEKENVKNILNDMKDELEEKFGKFSSILNNIKKKNMQLVYLKHMCSSLKLRLISSRTSKREGKKVIAFTMYSIESNL